MAFINILLVVIAILAVVVLTLSFILWTVPPFPAAETINFAIRIVLATTAGLTLIYSASIEYKEAVADYLRK
jgi:hypothetical protein